jgi:hypothetical protein
VRSNLAFIDYPSRWWGNHDIISAYTLVSMMMVVEEEREEREGIG